uniref:Hexosyltransferase n=1 Tax=Sphenodon punctatus TaxID=8508 RepID=A0A8D0H571_SPHPU
MQGSQCMTVVLALLTLGALKAYIDWSAVQPERQPTSRGVGTAWPPSPISAAEALDNEELGLSLRLNASLQLLRQNIPEASAFWNRRQHQIFRALEGVAGNASRWECGGDGGREAAAEIKDFSSYPVLYQRFLLHGDCRNYPLLVNQPAKCAGNRTFLLLAIKSVPGNFAARQAVRETWGREGNLGGLPVRTVFLLGSAQGSHEPDLRQLVEYESQLFRDVLMWDFEDTFFNLTLKDWLFLNWTVGHCPGARFILKGDDDVFINTPKVLGYLGSLDTHTAQTLYTGQVMANASPFRLRKSKYYVPESFYVGPYPAYAGGGGYVFSGRLVHRLLQVSQYIPFYPIDDVYTGLCFQGLGVHPQAHPDFQTFDIAEKDREDPCVHNKLLLVHRRSPQQTVRLWRQLGDAQLQC